MSAPRSTQTTPPATKASTTTAGGDGDGDEGAGDGVDCSDGGDGDGDHGDDGGDLVGQPVRVAYVSPTCLIFFPTCRLGGVIDSEVVIARGLSIGR